MTKKTLLIALAFLLPLTAGAQTVKSKFNKTGALRFDYKAEELAPAEERGRVRLEKALSAITAIPKANRTFENTVLAYNKAFEDYSEEFNTALFLAYVSPDKALRDAAGELEEKVSKFLIEVGTRKELYNAFKEYVEVKPKLGAPEERLIEKMMLSFKDQGLTLPDAELEKFRELNKKQIELGLAFDKVLREQKDFLAVTAEELDGLDQNYINRLTRTDDGKYKVTLDYPDYRPFMANSKSDSARKALEIKFNTRGGEENVKRLEEMLKLRAESSRLLGYKNFAEFRLASRMAKQPSNVESFLGHLQKDLRPLDKKETKTLLDYKKEKTGIKSKELTQWDFTYWSTQYKKEFYDLDEDKVQEYFPTDYVLANMLSMFGSLLDVKFTQVNIPVWHKDVKAFEVSNVSDGKKIAYFYMDLYPREGKYKHAAQFDLVKGYQKEDGSYQLPVAAVVANFNPPSGAVPSLLKHSEAVTLFHEFGHVTHEILTTAKYAEYSGTAVARDFVEVPSQLLENWAWDPGILKKITKHYKTGEALPDDMIKKMLNAKNFGNGLHYVRQNFLASYDMALHTKTKPVNTTKVYYDLTKKIRNMHITPGTLPQASFSHIMHGYEAGYYGYLWSEVIAHDFFSVFAKEGVTNPATGKRYRDEVLAVGGMYDENDTVKKFLGRPMSDKAFLNSIFSEEPAK